MEQEIFAWLGKITVWAASVGLSSSIVFFFIKIWGKKFIENIFAKDFESFKAQKLHEFDLLLSRKIKWHDKEHEVLATAWAKLVKAEKLMKIALNPRWLDNLDKKDDEEFKSFLDSQNLSPQEKQDIIKARNDKKANEVYVKILKIRDLDNANEAIVDFEQYFNENRIFIMPHIKDNFMNANEEMRSAWISKLIGIRDSNFDAKAMEKLYKGFKPVANKIESTVQDILFPENNKDKS